MRHTGQRTRHFLGACRNLFAEHGFRFAFGNQRARTGFDCDTWEYDSLWKVWRIFLFWFSFTRNSVQKVYLMMNKSVQPSTSNVLHHQMLFCLCSNFWCSKIERKFHSLFITTKFKDLPKFEIKYYPSRRIRHLSKTNGKNDGMCEYPLKQ